MIPKKSAKESMLVRVLALLAFCLLAIGLLVLLIRLRPTSKPAPAPYTPPPSDLPAPTPTTSTPADVSDEPQTYTDPLGYSFDVPEGYSVTHNITSEFEQWVITADPTSEMDTPFPEMMVQNWPSSAEEQVRKDAIKTKTVTINTLKGTEYTYHSEELGADCTLIEFVVGKRSYVFLTNECMESAIYDQVVQSFRKGSTAATPPSRNVSTDNPFTLRVGESVTMMGDSDMGDRPVGAVTLAKINDSRCKPGVQCIWAGELAAEVTYTPKDGPTQTLHLGLMTKSCDQDLTLQAITETSATFVKTNTCK